METRSAFRARPASRAGNSDHLSEAEMDALLGEARGAVGAGSLRGSAQGGGNAHPQPERDVEALQAELLRCLDSEEKDLALDRVALCAQGAGSDSDDDDECEDERESEESDEDGQERDEDGQERDETLEADLKRRRLESGAAAGPGPSSGAKPGVAAAPTPAVAPQEASPQTAKRRRMEGMQLQSENLRRTLRAKAVERKKKSYRGVERDWREWCIAKAGEDPSKASTYLHEGHPRIPQSDLVLAFLHHVADKIGCRSRKGRKPLAKPLSYYKCRTYISGLLFVRALYVSELKGGVMDLSESEFRIQSFKQVVGVKEFLNTLYKDTVARNRHVDMMTVGSKVLPDEASLVRLFESEWRFAKEGSLRQCLQNLAYWALGIQRCLRYGDAIRLSLHALELTMAPVTYGSTPIQLDQRIREKTNEGLGANAGLVLCAGLQQSKTNTGGKRRRIAFVRHRNPLLCPIGLLGLLLLYELNVRGMTIDVTEMAPPEIEGGLPYPKWWDILVLAAPGDKSVPMEYQTAVNAIKRGLEAAEIRTNKRTHALRVMGVNLAEYLGGALEECARLGGWILGAMDLSYLNDEVLPMTTMMAGHGNPNSARGGDLHCPRALVAPPPDLREAVLPQSRIDQWIAQAQTLSKDHQHSVERVLGPNGVVATLVRTVALQDLAVLQDVNPAHPLFSEPVLARKVFTRESWEPFKKSVVDVHKARGLLPAIAPFPNNPQLNHTLQTMHQGVDGALGSMQAQMHSLTTLLQRVNYSVNVVASQSEVLRQQNQATQPALSSVTRGLEALTQAVLEMSQWSSIVAQSMDARAQENHDIMQLVGAIARALNIDPAAVITPRDPQLAQHFQLQSNALHLSLAQSLNSAHTVLSTVGTSLTNLSQNVQHHAQVQRRAVQQTAAATEHARRSASPAVTPSSPRTSAPPPPLFSGQPSSTGAGAGVGERGTGRSTSDPQDARARLDLAMALAEDTRTRSANPEPHRPQMVDSLLQPAKVDGQQVLLPVGTRAPSPSAASCLLPSLDKAAQARVETQCAHLGRVTQALVTGQVDPPPTEVCCPWSKAINKGATVREAMEAWTTGVLDKAKGSQRVFLPNSDAASAPPCKKSEVSSTHSAAKSILKKLAAGVVAKAVHGHLRIVDACAVMEETRRTKTGQVQAISSYVQFNLPVLWAEFVITDGKVGLPPPDVYLEDVNRSLGKAIERQKRDVKDFDQTQTDAWVKPKLVPVAKYFEPTGKFQFP